jgi:hypothetical protein
MLATLTACNNSESAPEESQQQTFQSKTTAREGETTDEKEAMAEAIEIITKDEQLGGNTDSRILCHTPYSYDSGHACVQSGIFLFQVDWSIYNQMGQTIPGPKNDDGTSSGYIHFYTAHQTSSCNCR